MNFRAIHTCLLLASLSGAAFCSQQKSEPAARRTPSAITPADTHAGERVFAANCSRCHQPPMSLSPRVTGTVIMHMRTRARLSREDEKLLLKYLAP